MNKAKAMLDALMGPSRDTSSKEITSDDWKDRRVCKSFLVAVCPYDKTMLGGRKGIEICPKIHNPALRNAFEDHADGAPDSRFREKCEDEAFDVLSDALTARDKWAREQASIKNAELKIRTGGLDKEVGKMKRQVCEIKEKADAIDDTASVANAALKSQLLKEYADGLAEYEVFRKDKEDKEKAAAPKANSCKICGTAYLNDDDYNLHVGWTRHTTYLKIQEHYDSLKEKKDKRNAEKTAARAPEKETRTADNEKAPPEKNKSRSMSKGRKKSSKAQAETKDNRHRDDRDTRRHRDDRDRNRDDRDRYRRRSRSRSRDKDRRRR
mmetsp:Transcript_20633/g.33276  ORF Transcript_20633/g.33276 Transcript_20633/m.33276 type:complete len:324 (-) Transcript_20633:189-1160(-)